MCLHSVGFSYLRNRVPQRDRRWADAIRRQHERCTLVQFSPYSQRSPVPAVPMLAFAHLAQDPVPPRQSLDDVGLFVGFAWHWF